MNNIIKFIMSSVLGISFSYANPTYCKIDVTKEDSVKYHNIVVKSLDIYYSKQLDLAVQKVSKKDREKLSELYDKNLTTALNKIKNQTGYIQFATFDDLMKNTSLLLPKNKNVLHQTLCSESWEPKCSNLSLSQIENIKLWTKKNTSQNVIEASFIDPYNYINLRLEPIKYIDKINQNYPHVAIIDTERTKEYKAEISDFSKVLNENIKNERINFSSGFCN
ncbi:hypothetical protein [Francisella philomiragia]|uniref:hypothetical protein n=1 Tax=Francisella philomiragia TaxID=28110 RepID=UPI003514ADE9